MFYPHICTKPQILIYFLLSVFLNNLEYLYAVAPLNIPRLSVTLEISQLPTYWLKDLAFSNILLISVTFDVFQLPIGWLKDLALLNIHLISVTFEVFQFPIGWLKDFALANMALIFETLEVSQFPIGCVKDAWVCPLSALSFCPRQFSFCYLILSQHSERQNA